MKAITALLAMLLCICLLTPLSAQENTKGQLWYCYEETVKPGEVDVYKELSKEMLVLCKETDFPFPIYTWTPGDFKFQLWSPINTLDDIDKIGDAWTNIIESWDQEKYAQFNSTKIRSFSFTARALPDLDYTPENPRITMDELGYEQWRELYIIPGKLQEAKNIVKEINEIAKSKGYSDAWYYLIGGIGYESPVLIVFTTSKNKMDALEQDKNFQKVFGDDINELRDRFYACTYTRKNKELWFLRDLVYEPAE